MTRCPYSVNSPDAASFELPATRPGPRCRAAGWPAAWAGRASRQGMESVEGLEPGRKLSETTVRVSEKRAAPQDPRPTRQLGASSCEMPSSRTTATVCKSLRFSNDAFHRVRFVRSGDELRAVAPGQVRPASPVKGQTRPYPRRRILPLHGRHGQGRQAVDRTRSW